MFGDYQQIQAYPTAILYVKRGTSGLQDFALATVEHVGPFTALTGINETVTELGTDVGVKLMQMVANAGNVTETITENPIALVQLNSLVHTSPVTQTQSESVSSSVVLNSMVHTTGVSRSVSDDVTAGVKLNSMVL